MNSQPNLIDALGGPKKVAEMLGIHQRPGAVQRVGNWKRRGIPAQVLIDNPAFYRKVKAALGGAPVNEYLQRPAKEPSHA